MKFTFAHNNFKRHESGEILKFYERPWDLRRCAGRRQTDGSFILVYLGDGVTPGPGLN